MKTNLLYNRHANVETGVVALPMTLITNAHLPCLTLEGGGGGGGGWDPTCHLPPKVSTQVSTIERCAIGAFRGQKLSTWLTCEVKGWLASLVPGQVTYRGIYNQPHYCCHVQGGLNPQAKGRVDLQMDDSIKIM